MKDKKNGFNSGFDEPARNLERERREQEDQVRREVASGSRRPFKRSELAAIADDVRRRHNAALGSSHICATLGMALVEALGKLPVASEEVP